MDSYLEIAEQVLRKVRKPLSARQILKLAYESKFVPKHLHGKTQHKTLQARIAEDILIRRARSPFMRTEPGRFILRALLNESSLTEEFREYPAPRRADQLRNFYVLTFLCDHRELKGRLLRKRQAMDFIESHVPKYVRLSSVLQEIDRTFIRVFTIVTMKNKLAVQSRGLSHQDCISDKRSIGLFGYVKDIDRTLFSHDQFGYTEAAVRTIIDQLSISEYQLTTPLHQYLSLCGLMGSPNTDSDNSCAFVMHFACPKDFDPIRKLGRSSGFCWGENVVQTNDFEAFEPWSRQVLESGLLRDIFPDGEPSEEGRDIERRAVKGNLAHPKQRSFGR